MSPEELLKIRDHFSDLNRYDDDAFTSPECIDNLSEDEKSEVLDWIGKILHACATDTAHAVLARVPSE